jgi:hypothetical protein
MSGMISTSLRVSNVLLVAAALLSQTAQAEKLRRAEQGDVRLELADPIAAEAPVTVRSGETVWQERARPVDWVRLLDSAPLRIRPGRTLGPEAGSLLFAYDLSRGQAYCAPIDIDKAIARVQCLRDVDGDGTFEGGYVTDTGSGMPESRYLPAMLRGLTGIGTKVRYEPANAGPEQDAKGEVLFAGMHKGRPQFRLRIERELIDEPFACEPIEGGAADECSVLDVQVSVQPMQNGSAQVQVLSANPGRGVIISNVGLTRRKSDASRTNVRSFTRKPIPVETTPAAPAPDAPKPDAPNPAETEAATPDAEAATQTPNTDSSS